MCIMDVPWVHMAHGGALVGLGYYPQHVEPVLSQKSPSPHTGFTRGMLRAPEITVASAGSSDVHYGCPMGPYGPWSRFGWARILLTAWGPHTLPEIALTPYTGHERYVSCTRNHSSLSRQ